MIEKMIMDELDKMCKKHNQEKFNSYHEWFAVILEEFEELSYEVKLFENQFKTIWNQIKGDKFDKDSLIYLEKTIKRLITESVQVGACIEKMKRGF